MPIRTGAPVWKTAPFLRLLVPFIAGILLQYYRSLPLHIIAFAASSFCLSVLLFRFFPLPVKYQWRSLQGVSLHLLMFSAGLFVCWQRDIRHRTDWVGKVYKTGDYLILRLSEPPVEKENTYKANSIIESLLSGNKAIHCCGNVLLYFSKNAAVKKLHYGDRILLRKPLHEIQNQGNPGEFDYQQYAAFRQIFHAVYLQEREWMQLKEPGGHWLWSWIVVLKQRILAIIQKNIPGENSIAEALLIGYTSDLDNNTVQAYNTAGVAHLISLSGMSLGLLYLLLGWLFGQIPFIRRSALLRLACILLCLWTFALVTALAAAVLRAAVMLTIIGIGNASHRKTSVYNAIAASAFVLLCCNPYFLWDVGFQLSYLSIFSIAVFYKPVYKLMDVGHPLLHKIWSGMSATIAVQVLLFPACLYYFHQFPFLFLFTNLLTMPLSTLVLLLELLLLLFSWFPSLALLIGKTATWLIKCMNLFVFQISHLSFAFADNVPTTLPTVFLLYAALLLCCFAWFFKNKSTLLLSLLLFALLILWNVCEKWVSLHQSKMIVYNIPRYRAVDFINGDHYYYKGDGMPEENPLLHDNSLKPARVHFRCTAPGDACPYLYHNGCFYQQGNQRIFFADSLQDFSPDSDRIKVDLVVLSGQCKVSIQQMVKRTSCRRYVADASVSMRHIALYKEACAALHLSFYAVSESGAFILNTADDQ